MLHKTIRLTGGQKIFFTSDPHYGHKNICRGTTEWNLEDHGGGNSVRNFDTLDKMNDALVNGINETVRQDDILVIAGDFAFGGIQNIPTFRKRILCRNIIYVLGNHDHHIERNKVLPDQMGTKIQELFSSVHTHLILTVKSDNESSRTYDIFHYPIAIWNKAHHNRIHLYGHVHNSYTHPGRALDIGMDSAFAKMGVYTPFSEDNIRFYMSKREFQQFSHHNSKTN